ncbi:MAG TPA: aspartate--ammonia ligase [Bacteroidia bacterium]|nr:aspartate--ammonia ligase [Bacteroidia bacterium]
METIEKKTKTYQSVLTEYQTESAIASLKAQFSLRLSEKLNLIKVEAPLLIAKGNGINDDLNGIEDPVTVKVKDLPSTQVEIVHSLAKWKRLKLARLKAKAGEGLYTDMKALRPDEDLSDVHSVYVDQWDWEKVILESNRQLPYLKKIVTDIYQTIVETEKYITASYPELKRFLPQEIAFIHSEELQQLYPGLTSKERENEISKQKGAVFIIGIGAELADGKKHDGRAPDYDDWITETSADKKGLNGDIVVWNPVLKRAFEISSMGIRVSPESLRKQLLLTGSVEREKLDWHTKLLKGELPYTIGGGIGQSRLAMLLLQKKHIAEVQSSIWPDELSAELKELNIIIL